MNPKLQAAANSYLRALVAAAIPVWVATNDWRSTLHAFWAAAIPPIMRWANPKDPTLGKANNDN